MTDAEFRDELTTLVRKHAAELDPEDLRAAAEDLDQTAEQWEGIAL